MQQELLNTDFKLEEIVSKLLTYHVCIVPGFIAGQELGIFRQDFDDILNDTDVDVIEKPHQVTAYFSPGRLKAREVDGINLNLGGNELVEKYDSLEKLTKTPMFAEIVRGYFGDEEAVYPVRWQVLRSTGTPEVKNNAPYTLHFDRQRFLKFYTPLTDVSDGDGSLTFLFGEQHWQQGKSGRENERARVNDWPKINNSYEEQFDNENMTALELKAGDLVIFDSDVPHKQGEILSGKAREVIILESQTLLDYDDFKQARAI